MPLEAHPAIALPEKLNAEKLLDRQIIHRYFSEMCCEVERPRGNLLRTKAARTILMKRCLVHEHCQADQHLP